MERKINNLSIGYTFFLIMLLLSGSLMGIMSDAVYAIAFILPFVFVFAVDKQSFNGSKGLFGISKDNLNITIPLMMPTVLVVIIVSAVTSFLIWAVTGAQNQVDVGKSLIPALISHALIPSILEEALFRYLPLKVLGRESGRLTVIISALFFAFSHHNLFSIPYAFVAGIIFMAIDLIAESVIPSLILHFINNAISVAMLVYADNSAFTPAIMIILVILSVISVWFIIKNRAVYQDKMKEIFKKNTAPLFTFPLIIFVLISLFVAIVAIM